MLRAKLYNLLRENLSTISSMKYSLVEISEIEARYNISLPRVYKLMLLLIGEKIMDFNKYTQAKSSKSICQIQRKIIDSIKSYESSEEKISHRLNDVFYITSSLEFDEDTKHYFIRSNNESDCPVYCWTYHGSSDTNSIEKISETLEEWLYEMSCVVYLEWQLRKVFCNVSDFC
jgi:SMI1-KNR4 cell-wall